jgi:uncharacterized protein YecT (DUF1311 family)
MLTLVVCTCLIVIMGIVHAAKKSSALTPPHRFRLLLAASVGALGLSLGACVIVAMGVAPARVGPSLQSGESSASSDAHRNATKANTVLTEHRVVIPDPTSTPNAVSAQRRRQLSAPNDRPSFDCAKAELPDELTICADLSLRRADGALGRIYQAALATLTPASRLQLIQGQKAWILDRRQRCGTDARCFFDAIQSRSQQLR